MANYSYQVILSHKAACPLGRIVTSSYYWFSTHAREIPLRVMGAYCLSLILEGNGIYHDARGHIYPLAPGDCIVVMPDVGVRYSPPMGSSWCELYLLFEGPIFDCLRRQGLLDPRTPILKLGSPEIWREKLEAVLRAPHETVAEQTVQTAAFANLLVEMLVCGSDMEAGPQPADWLERACNRLRYDIARPLDIPALARELGLSHETFRKRFRAACGKSPNQYRTHWRLEAAKSLLRESNLSGREIAATIGYGSEYHFSRKFKEATGQSPRQFRRNAANPRHQP